MKSVSQGHVVRCKWNPFRHFRIMPSLCNTQAKCIQTRIKRIGTTSKERILSRNKASWSPAVGYLDGQYGHESVRLFLRDRSAGR